MLPFTYRELRAGRYASDRIETALFVGAYPPVFDQALDPVAWYNSYIESYLERDVRQILRRARPDRVPPVHRALRGKRRSALQRLTDGGRLRHGLRHDGPVAVRAGRNLRRLPPPALFQELPQARGQDAQALLLGHGARGAAAWRTRRPNNWRRTPFRAALYTELGDQRAAENQLPSIGERPNLYFWRDSAGLEVNLLEEVAGRLRATEVKSGATFFTAEWTESLSTWLALAATDTEPGARVVYGGERSFAFKGCNVVSWRELERA